MIDRAFQRDILDRLKQLYPHGMTDPVKEFEDISERKIWANIVYLMEHGLVDGISAATESSPVRYMNVRITARGIDFMEDDGGLSAVLGTVTVRFAEDQFKEMLASHIKSIAGPSSVKDRLVSTLRALPANALNVVALRALEAGLSSLATTDAVQTLLYG